MNEIGDDFNYRYNEIKNKNKSMNQRALEREEELEELER